MRIQVILKTGMMLILMGSVLSGCARSISNSGYSHSGYSHSGNNSRSQLNAELSEFDVLGIQSRNDITEEEIAKAFTSEKAISIAKGSSVMVIQSGAPFPDESMRAALSEHLEVVSFAGLREKSMSGESFSKTLRLAAAQGGLDHILCYWGMLETTDAKLATKTVSWVPIVGKLVPDENQLMRIQLKMAVIDLRTGQWTMITPSAEEDKAISMGLTRESSDQHQVAKLKEEGYKVLVEELSQKHIIQ